MSQFNPKKILVIKHGSLGDIAFSLLAMSTIRKYFNHSNIDLLTEGRYVNFLKKSGSFNSIFEDSRGGILNTLKAPIPITLLATSPHPRSPTSEHH